MTIRIKRCRMTSPSAKRLKDSLHFNGVEGTRLLLMEGTNWQGNSKSLLVNWGSTSPINRGTRAKVLNKPEAISKATNKIKTFEALEESGINFPWYVRKNRTDFFSEVLTKMCNSDILMFRTTSSGYGGEGIHVLKDIKKNAAEHVGTTEENLTNLDIRTYASHLFNSDTEWSPIIRSTKFVTEYFKARDEYRVHVICGGVAFCQRKGLRTDDDRPEEVNFFVRNHSNGFIFQQNDIEVPEAVKQASVRAVQALGLDFGAVDIRWNSRTGEYSVLEVNTAPAITGNTLTKYTEVFKSIHDILQES